MYDENGRRYLDCINNVAHGELCYLTPCFSKQNKEQSVLLPLLHCVEGGIVLSRKAEENFLEPIVCKIMVHI